MSGYLNLYRALMVVTTLYLPTSSPSMLAIYKARLSIDHIDYVYVVYMIYGLSSFSNLVLVKFLEDTVVPAAKRE